MRDIISHQYNRVRLETVWLAVQTELPPLVPRIAQLEETVRRQEEGAEGE